MLRSDLDELEACTQEIIESLTQYEFKNAYNVSVHLLELIHGHTERRTYGM